MINRGELVIVAVSGGPDSMALLTCLNKLQKDMGFRLHVVHINHGMRPESEEEAEFVTGFAASLGISTKVEKLDPHELKAGSFQELARQKRREIFLEESRRLGATKIALGHNANDQAETVLQRLLRGGGSSGLGGIHPIREQFIRPLIFASRGEIEEYLKQEGLDFRVDNSNFKPVYLRNKIRLSLIPELEKEYNPQLVEILGKTAMLLQEDNNYLEQQAEKKVKELVVGLGDKFFLPDVLSHFPKPIGTRMVRIIYSKLTGDPRGLEYDHVTNVLKFGTVGRSGSTLELPSEVKILKELDGLLFYQGELCWPELSIQQLSVPGETIIPGTNQKISARFTDKLSLAPADKWSASICAEKIEQPIGLRMRKPGDKILVRGKYRKLKELFNELRVPIRVREAAPLVVMEDKIIWIPGIIKSDEVLGQECSDKVLELVFSNN